MSVAATRASIWRDADELLGRPVSMRALALLRVAAGPIVLAHLRPFLVDAWHGRIYRDAFWEPYAAWYPDLPRGVYVALLFVGAAAAVLMATGLFTRVSCAVTFGVVAYNLFLSTTHFHNNRAYLVIVLAVLAVTPCGRELSVDAWRSGRPPTLAPAWPLWLLRFECSAVYAASGMSKLLDPDWFGGTVPWQRVVQARDEIALPDWLMTVLLDRDVYTVAGKLIVFTELFIAFGLWSRRTRYAAVWVAICFHVAIQFSAAIEVFSVLAISVLAIWAVPSTRDRVLRVEERWSDVVRRLDWLARFRVEPGSGWEVVDRDGTVLRGTAAAVLVFSRLPLTAWFALPARLLWRAS